MQQKMGWPSNEILMEPVSSDFDYVDFENVILNMVCLCHLLKFILFQANQIQKWLFRFNFFFFGLFNFRTMEHI